MGQSLGEAILELATDDRKLLKGLKKAGASIKKFGEGMKQAGKNLTMTVSAPLAAFGALALKTAGDFQAGMNQVAAVSGATGKQLTELKDQAKLLGETTQFSATQAAEGMGFLAQAGFEANEILAAMPKTLELAAASQMSLGDTADTVSNILAGYNLEVKDLGRVNDVLVKAFTSSNTNLQQLGEAMKFAGPIASAAGVGFEEAAAALGLMGNAGIQASMAGTSLRGAIAKSLSPTTEVAAKMKALGLNFKDAKGKLLPLVDIIRQLGPHAKDAGLLMEIFGLRAGPAMAALIGQGADKLQEFTDQLKNAGGTSARIAAVQMAGFNGAMKEMKSAFEGVLIALGESGMIDLFTDLAKSMAANLRALSRMNPAFLKTITVVAAIAIAIGPALIIFGQLAIAIGALIPIMAGIPAVLGLIKIALLGLIGPGAALALLGVAVIMWIDNWEELRDGTIVIVKFLVEQIPLLFNTMIENVFFIFQEFKRNWNVFWAGWKTDALFIIDTFITAIAQKFASAFPNITEKLTKFKDDTILVFQSLADILVGNSIIPDMVKAIKIEFDGLTEAVGESAKETQIRVVTAFQGMADEMGAALGGLTADLLQGKKSFGDFALAAVKAFAKIAAAKAALSIGGPLGGFLGTFAGAFADGGFIPPGQFGVVGEEGPELAFGGRSGMTIQSNGGGGGGFTFAPTFQVSGMDLGSGEAVRKFMDTAARETKRGARELLEFARVSGDRNEIVNRRAA